MKYLAFILTIYVLALAVWPCCGDETSLSSEHEDLCYSVSSEKHADNHESPHACSPFFHSSTYHAFVAAPAVNRAPALFTAERKSGFPEGLVAAVVLFPGDIWQPPQLV